MRFRKGLSKKKEEGCQRNGHNWQMQDFLGLEMLDANKLFKRIGGDVYSELWKGLRKGLDKKINHWREAMDFINELVDPKNSAEMDRGSGEGI